MLSQVSYAEARTYMHDVLLRETRVATRYGKAARNYLAFCQLASAMVLLA